MTTVIRDMPLDVCVDCIQIIANGTLGSEDHDADTKHVEAMTAELGATDVAHLVLDTPEDDEWIPYFSSRTCSGCGSPLGGDRFPARVLHVVP